MRCCLPLGAALACSFGPTAPAVAQRNNVLILIADDVGVDSVTTYALGSNPPPTPNLDALAARGVLFRNAWANPLCSPTRACLMTGRYSFRTGVGTSLLAGVAANPPLPLLETTLPEQLDRAASGYAHAAFGKWHLSDERNGGALGPNLAGWGHYAGGLNGVASYYRWARTVNGVTATSTRYATTQTVDDALAWIVPAVEPWVCYVAFHAGHSPYQAPPAHLHTYNLAGINPHLNPWRYYKATVQAMDAEIGRLLNGLGPRLARTDVVFLADNGTAQEVTLPPFIPAHGKGTPYEGGVRVPLLVAGPSVVAPGRQVDALVSAVDVFATVAEWCGVDPQPPWVRIDAVSLLPYLRDPAQAPLRTTLFAELFNGSPTSASAIMAIREDRYKLIRREWLRQEELYDLLTDPFEQNDLLLGALTPAQHATHVRLKQELAALRNPLPSLTPYGTQSCLGSNGYPAIAGAGSPRVGAAYAVALTRAASAQPAWLCLGASRTRWAGVGLPLPLTALGGAPNCLVWASLEILLPTVTDAFGDASLPIVVPNEPVLVAGSFFHCWLAMDPASPANPLGVTTSDGLEAVIGR